MPSYNSHNERIKRQFFTYLKEAHGHNSASVDAAAKALARFETDTGFRDFRNFNRDQAIAFKRRLAEQTSLVTGQKLSKATLHSTLGNLKRFFHWLAGQPGYKSRLSYSESEYFNLSDKETRIATARREKRVPTLEQVKHVIRSMRGVSEIERRDRALIAFTLLTGARDSAIASLKLKHVDLAGFCVNQDAREVRTKFSKTFISWFFPVGDDIIEIVSDWVTYLRTERLWGNDDPLFPSTEVTVDASLRFAPAGLMRAHWSTATPIRRIFRQAFEAAGLPYFNPHSLRSTLTLHGYSLRLSQEEAKVWSQNLGHDDVMTTYRSYGPVSGQRQAEIMRQLAQPRDQLRPEMAEFVKAVALELRGALKPSMPGDKNPIR